ncbi:hypothetical protein BRADI_1g44096v3, partial [Brachypodium distachyon]
RTVFSFFSPHRSSLQRRLLLPFPCARHRLPRSYPRGPASAQPASRAPPPPSLPLKVPPPPTPAAHLYPARPPPPPPSVPEPPPPPPRCPTRPDCKTPPPADLRSRPVAADLRSRPAAAAIPDSPAISCSGHGRDTLGMSSPSNTGTTRIPFHDISNTNPKGNTPSLAAKARMKIALGVAYALQ